MSVPVRLAALDTIPPGMNTNAPSSISPAKRILLSFVISWVAAVSLGNIYGASVVGTFSIADLWVKGVIQVATIISSVAGVLLTPLVAWGLRSYGVIKWIVILWLVVVAWILAVFALTHNGGIVLDGALLLSVAGLIGIRFLSRR